jgi:hypothetical protein
MDHPHLDWALPAFSGCALVPSSATSWESPGQANDEGRTLYFAGLTDNDAQRTSPFNQVIPSLEIAVAVFFN